ncbi:MAG: carbohydrate kinase [Rhodospirillaceae bacterium]|nr:carbohydrate kinase [Rhodospirillaceae bacterium]
MTASPLIFGEVLFDHFPNGDSVLGGAPFNVAWHLQAFGGHPLLISRVGNDPSGRDVRSAMHNWGMDDSGLQDDPQRPTGRVDIEMVNGEPLYTIHPGAAFDAIRAEALPPIPNAGAALIYHGTLALRTNTSRAGFDTLRHFSGAPLFLDVNLRAPWWHVAETRRMVANARWVKLNADELAHLAIADGDIPTRAKAWIDAHHLDLVVVTLGAQGAIAIDGAGTVIAPPPPKTAHVIDPVGAGDAFSAVLILGLMRGWDIALTLDRAQAFASAIVGQRGALAATPTLYRDFAKDWQITCGMR